MPGPIEAATLLTMLDENARADRRFGTIPRMVRASAASFGAADAIVDGARRLSFREVEAEMFAVARSLLAMGIEPGDRVAVWAPNSAAWIAAANGVLAARGCLVPLNTRLKGEEAAYILAKTDARALLAADGFLGHAYVESVRDVAPDLRALDHAIHMPLPGERSADGWTAFLDQGATRSDADVEASIAAATADDVSDIIFTSGTTGLPKGVMLRHGASLRGYQLFSDRFGLNAGDRYVVPTPFFHCFGYKAGWMISLMTGSVAFPLAVFDADAVLELIHRERVTHMPGPPTMFSALLDHPKRRDFDLSSLTNAIIGAASIPAVVVHRMRDELGIDAILGAYGLTENHALVSLTQPDDPVEVIATTVGRPLPDVEVRIADDGELLVRGPYLMSGYFDDEAATASAIVDGWLRTGDVGHFDEDALLHITDRKKDLFIVGGFNVAPAEVEKVLVVMDEIAQVAVVGMPDDYFGEVGAAFVVPHVGVALTEEAVLNFARERLANFKVPRRVELVDELPLNATGKVLKTELRRRLTETALGA